MRLASLRRIALATMKSKVHKIYGYWCFAFEKLAVKAISIKRKTLRTQRLLLSSVVGQDDAKATFAPKKHPILPSESEHGISVSADPQPACARIQLAPATAVCTSHVPPALCSATRNAASRAYGAAASAAPKCVAAAAKRTAAVDATKPGMVRCHLPVRRAGLRPVRGQRGFLRVDAGSVQRCCLGPELLQPWVSG